MLARVFGPEFHWVSGLAALVGAVGLAWLSAHFSARTVRMLLLALSGGDPAVPFTSPIVRRPIRTIWVVVFLLVFVTLSAPALEMAGAQVSYGLRLRTLTDWLLRSGLHVVVIVLLAYAISRIVGAVVSRLEKDLSRDGGLAGMERAKRVRTLGNLIRSVVNAVLAGVAILMVLQEFQVNIVPVLTGAGIAGLAVGFGAQTLVRDFISGFFLIFEDQVRVGDVASINGTSGLVEDITLRTIVLRDLSGTVHVIPNGSVEMMSNLTKDFSFYVIDMGVAYKEDTDEVIKIMVEVAAEMQADPTYAPSMLAPLEVLGVDAFEDSQVTIKARLKTVPLKQWEVGREYRRRIKKAFDARGIEIPFPHVSVYFGEASKPWAIVQQGAKTEVTPR